jgi:AraC-like DNA-binding protein
MKHNRHTISESMLRANENGLLCLLQKSNRLHLAQQLKDIKPKLVIDAEHRVPLDQVTKRINNVSKLMSEDNLGLKVLSLVDMDTIEFYQTIKKSINVLFRDHQDIPFELSLLLITHYFSIMTEVATIETEFHHDKVIIKVIPTIPEIINIHQIEGLIVGVCRLIGSFNRQKPARVALSHSQPENSDHTYLSILGVLPDFNQPEILLEYYLPFLAENMDDKLLAVIGPLQTLMNSQFPSTKITQSCEHILKSLLHYGEPKREHVAKVLHMSVSSLQRRLKEDGTTFKELLLAIRKELTFDLLITQNQTVSDTAFLLGYKSNSQFFKAFRQWFSCTPSQFKQQH